VRAAKLPHLRAQSLDRGCQCGPIESSFAKGDDFSLPRRVEHDFDALYGAILFKAHNRVNRLGQSARCLA
jgi:hypothetical protein